MSATALPPVLAAPRTKPLLRGVSHEIAFYLALLAGTILTWRAPPGRPTWVAAVYGVCMAGMLGISALYHRPTWTPLARQRLRRLDHAGIFLMIAGTYSPILVLAVPGPPGERLLVAVWTGALLGILKSLFWLNAPKAIMALLCVLLGWAAMGEWSAIHAGIGDRGAYLLFVGGLLYSVGALVYALKRPDPLPNIFGYHEIFHLLVIVAALCHFWVVQSLVFSSALQRSSG